MSPTSSASSGAPPSAVSAEPTGPPVIRRALALPAADASLGGLLTTGVAPGAALPAPTPPAAAASAAPNPAPGDGSSTPSSEPTGRGRPGGRLFPLPGRRHPAGRGGHTAANEAGANEAGAAGASAAGDRVGADAAHTGNRAAGGPTGIRAGHRPVLVAAAVAGAVLASVPFVQGRGGTVNYEGLGQSTPVATMSPGGPEADSTPEPDGHASSMPFQDPADGTATPFVPEPSGSPFLLGPRPPGPSLPGPSLPGSRLFADPHAPGPSAAPSAPGGKEWSLLRDNGLGLADKQKDEATGPEGSGRSKADGSPGHESAVSALKQKTASEQNTAPEQKTPDAGPSERSETPAKVSLLSTSAKSPAVTEVTTTRGERAQTTAKPVKAAARAEPTTPRWTTRVVHATTVLHRGESVASNRMRITMGTNGTLVISDEQGVIRWSSHTEGRGDRAVFQADGNFVVYSADNKGVWSSGTGGNPGATLVIQDDGNVTVRSSSGAALWTARTQR